MFTGIVEELGTVAQCRGDQLVVAARQVLEDAVTGASIAVNGCCLTVVDKGEDDAGPWWCAELSPETLGRTNLGDLRVGDRVNLERPVRLEDRLGGHLVQGHVDTVGELLRGAPDLEVRIPAGLMRYVIPKGSITVDGVSLTVVDPRSDSFGVAVIPHTAAVTTLGIKGPGDLVNIEVDMVAKYIERLVSGYTTDLAQSPAGARTEE